VVNDIDMNEVAVRETVLVKWFDSKPPRFHPYHGAAENNEP